LVFAVGLAAISAVAIVGTYMVAPGSAAQAGTEPERFERL
jgi:hypothetical protein